MTPDHLAKLTKTIEVRDVDGIVVDRITRVLEPHRLIEITYVGQRYPVMKDRCLYIQFPD